MSEEDKQTDENSIDDIDTDEGGSDFDATKYKGKQVKIASVTKIDDINYYNGPVGNDGRPAYNPASTEKCKKILVVTENLKELDENGNFTDKEVELGTDDEGNPRYVSVRVKLNLQKRTNEDKTVRWVISKTTKANLWRFMRNMGVQKLSELVGKNIVLATQADRDPASDKQWLRIVL